MSKNKTSRKTPALRPVFFLAAVGLLSVLLNSCYMFKQFGAMMDQRAKAKPNAELLQSPDTPEELKRFLRRVEDIRSYGREVLGLSDTGNFAQMVFTPKNHLVRVVNATAELSFKRYTWAFPFFGDSPYLGFYDDEDADKEAAEVKAKGYDVYVRDVDAFSTLGILRDPLYSFMKDYSDYSIANLLFHEQTHATLWVPGNFQFNEQLATFVGEQGALQYLRDKNLGGEDYAKRVENYTHDTRAFYERIAALRKSLEELYATAAPPEDLRQRKAQIIEDWRKAYLADYDKFFVTPSFKGAINVVVNNAWIDLYSTYTAELAAFSQGFQAVGGQILPFLNALRDHKVTERPPMDALNELIKQGQ